MRQRNHKADRRNRMRMAPFVDAIELQAAPSLAEGEEASPLGPRKLRRKEKWRRLFQPVVQKPVPPEEAPGTDSERPPERKSGEMAAVLLSIVLSMAVLTGAHWWSVMDPVVANMKLLKLASWLPGGLRIGPYAGKEIAALLVWLVSWALLHRGLRNKEVRLRQWLYAFIAVVFILLVLLWPPLYHSMFGWPA